MIDLALAKAHFNVDYDYDDDYITSLIEVAEQVVASDVCEDLSTLNDGTLPAPLRQAMLLLIGHYYASREPVAYVNVSEVPLSYKHLIGLFRNYEK